MDLTALQTWLAGKKTYLISISSIIGVVLSWVNKSTTDQQAIQDVIALVLAMTIRHGVTTSARTVVKQETGDDGIRIQWLK